MERIEGGSGRALGRCFADEVVGREAFESLGPGDEIESCDKLAPAPGAVK